MRIAYSSTDALGLDFELSDPALVNLDGANEDFFQGLGRVAVGTRVKGQLGTEFVYVKADGAITADHVCIIKDDYEASHITTALAAAYGRLVGVACGAIADNDFGWLQVKGIQNIRVLASAAAETQLATSGTAGALDDATTSTLVKIDGVVLIDVAGGSNDSGYSYITQKAMLNHPSIGVAY